MYGLIKPLFLGRLRHKRLTSNQMIGQYIRTKIDWLFDLMLYVPGNSYGHGHVAATQRWPSHQKCA